MLLGWEEVCFSWFYSNAVWDMCHRENKWRGDRGHNIIADGWVGAYNPQPYPPPPHTHSHMQRYKYAFSHFLTQSSRTDGWTEGPMDEEKGLGLGVGEEEDEAEEGEDEEKEEEVTTCSKQIFFVAGFGWEIWLVATSDDKLIYLHSLTYDKIKRKKKLKKQQIDTCWCASVPSAGFILTSC